jgi:hypothetical protein
MASLPPPGTGPLQEARVFAATPNPSKIFQRRTTKLERTTCLSTTRLFSWPKIVTVNQRYRLGTVVQPADSMGSHDNRDITEATTHPFSFLLRPDGEEPRSISRRISSYKEPKKEPYRVCPLPPPVSYSDEKGSGSTRLLTIAFGWLRESATDALI